MKRARPSSDAAFTLVEALTTMFILALMAGAVIVLAPGPERKTRAFVEEFATRIALASEESIIDNRSFALIVRDDGYGFARLEDRGWFPITHGSPLAFRPWPENVSYRVVTAGLTEGEGRVARFDAIGAATPTRILIDGAGAQWTVDIDGQGKAHVEQQ